VLPAEPSFRAVGIGASESSPFAQQMAASGPWFWAGNGPFSLNRGAVLITPWGEGTWGVARGGERAAPEHVFADFANSQHRLEIIDRECLRVRSTRRADGELVGVDYAGAMEGPPKCSLA
jgi:hypothetical protein